MIMLDENKLSNSTLRVILADYGSPYDIYTLESRSMIDTELDRMGLRCRGQREKTNPVDEAMNMTLGEIMEAINNYRGEKS